MTGYRLNAATITRRQLMGMGAATLVALSLPKLAMAQATPGAATPEAASGLQPDGSWVFTDDRGITVTLPGMPERIIADVNVAAALWDFGVRPVGIFGWNITGDHEFNAAGGNVDPDAVEFLNGPATTIDVELAAAADPDLIVSLVYAEQYGVWSIDQEVQSRVEEIAPIITISGIIRADEAMNRFAQLSQALGIDLNSPEIAAQKASYDAAEQRYTTLTTEKAGISAIFVWASESEIYVASPDAAGDVMLFRDLGLDVPTLPVPAGEYWEQLSAEQALKYPTDMLFYSLRGDGLISLEDFQAHPTMGQHPAVKAGQVYGWNQDYILSYPGLEASFTTTSDAIEASEPLVS
jgi:iron complex transport system substrate-binding protein